MKRGHESAEHREMKEAVAAWLRTHGFEVLFEHQLVDVLGYRVSDGHVIAVEVERTERNLLGNLRRNLRNGYTDILIIAPNVDKQRRYECVLRQHGELIGNARVRCITIDDLKFVQLDINPKKITLSVQRNDGF